MSLPPAPESWGIGQQLAHLINVVEDLRKTVATKEQVDKVESRTREEIRRVERETREETEKLHARINGIKNDLDDQKRRQEQTEAETRKQRAQWTFQAFMLPAGLVAGWLFGLLTGGH